MVEVSERFGFGVVSGVWGVIMTKRQREVLEAIEEYTAYHGCPPSLRDLMERFGFLSTQGVACHLDSLRKKGLVTWQPGKARTLRVVKKGIPLVELDPWLEG